MKTAPPTGPCRQSVPSRGARRPGNRRRLRGAVFPACRTRRHPGWADPAAIEAGADDRTRTGDLVLTKDALYLLSYIGTPVACRPPHARAAAGQTPARPGVAPATGAAGVPHRRNSRRPPGRARQPPAGPGACAEGVPGRGDFQRDRKPCDRKPRPNARELERETGIEPATNSLEGCDSTTELLPPSRLLPSWHADRLRRAAGRTKLVARGGFEPPKPLGRQIYSLLRLTAPQPRRIPQQFSPKNRDTRSRAGAAWRTDSDTRGHLANGDHTDAETHLSRGSNPLELAKGFEPPTR